MTKQEAKDLSLRKWRYLEANTNVGDPEDIGDIELLNELKHCRNFCPLCQLFYVCSSCFGCPLDDAGGFCFERSSLFFRWCYAITDVERSEAAGRIIKTIEAWRPE